MTAREVWINNPPRRFLFSDAQEGLKDFGLRCFVTVVFLVGQISLFFILLLWINAIEFRPVDLFNLTIELLHAIAAILELIPR